MTPPREPPRLPPEDQEIWDDIARQIKPLKKKAGAMPAPGRRTRAQSTVSERKLTGISPARPPAGLNHPGGYEVDGRTKDRLRQGKLRPEGRLDLHGMTQDAAHVALTGFIRDAHDRGMRCVLIITGKGQTKKSGGDGDWFIPAPGVLRERVPDWLRAPPLSGIVLRIQTAQPRDGGSGALYVLLRRRRD